MKTKNHLNLLFIVTACLLSACSESLHFHHWKAPGADFNKYSTYAWVAPGDTVLTMVRNDKLFAGTIYLYANQELAKKGMIMVKENPDAVFMFDTQVQDMTRYTQAPTLSMGVGYGGPGYYVGGMAPIAGGEISVVPYQEGRLIIEMFDVRTKRMVWRGWAEDSLDNNTDLSKELKDVIRNMMYTLPVKQKKKNP